MPLAWRWGFSTGDPMIKYLLMVAALTGCVDESERCQELWDMTHAEKTPMTYAYAKKCCADGDKSNQCIAKLWEKSDLKEGKSDE